MEWLVSSVFGSCRTCMAVVGVLSGWWRCGMLHYKWEVVVGRKTSRVTFRVKKRWWAGNTSRVVLMSTLIFSACNWLLLDGLSPQILIQSEYGNNLQVDKETTEEFTKEITWRDEPFDLDDLSKKIIFCRDSKIFTPLWNWTIMHNEGLGSLKTIYQRSIPQVLLVGHAYTRANLTECERKLKQAFRKLL